MQKFLNTEERSRLADAEESQFIETCLGEFVEKSLADSNRRKVAQLTMVSYLPNVLSAVTAGFFVLYLLSGYTRTVAMLLGGLLLVIVLAIEAGKRFLITGTAKTWFTTARVPPLSVVALVACFVLSMGASYLGGKQLVIATAPPPERGHNPQIDSLNRILADQQATVDRLQRTTWRGKVTSDAVKGINRAKALQASIYDRIATLEAQDDAAHAEVVATHTAKHLNFGIVLGLLASIADLFLLGMLWTAWKLKYQVAAVHFQAAPAGISTPHQGAGQYQYFNPMLNQQQPQQPASVPAQPHRRPIGFKVDATEEDDNAMRNNAMRITHARPTGKIKICKQCGNDFEARTTWHVYCCEACKVAAWEARTGKAFKKGKKAQA